MTPLDRRAFLGLAGAQTLGLPFALPAWAQGRDSISIAFPTDVPTWDPNARVLSAAQSLYKCVFDSPIGQGPNLAVEPSLLKSWRYRDPSALALELELRDDALFHNGDKVTATDFRYTFFERLKAPVPAGRQKLDLSFIWRKVKDIEVLSPTRAVMHFSEVMPSAVTWLYFIGSYVVPKDYMEKSGLDGFLAKPVGSGPYRLVEYQRGARIVLEAFDKFWKGPPKIRRVTIEVVQDASARVAAVESKRVDLAVDLPIREINRLAKVAGLTARTDAVTDIVNLMVTRTGLFEHEEVRLAAHHAIDKKAISTALFGGKAIPVDVPAAHNTPGYPEDFHFPYDPAKATALLAKAGFSPAKPAQIGFNTLRGYSPNDFETAQAIVAMWKKVGIEAKLEVIEATKYQELLRANKLPEVAQYPWGNTAGDPEMYGGYLLDPKSIFSAWKSEDMGERIGKLLVETDAEKRYAGYRDACVYAVQKGYAIPLFQSVKSVAYADTLGFTRYDNGWMLPQSYTMKA
ncbi:MAG TPA: ABC transporter substrate-binding protein [Reyranella sp.]|nr:ABC transporter substrate-binding protein [Reyranella sp.]